MLRNIQIADDEIDHVGEVVQTAEAGGAVLGDLDDAVDAFSDRVGQGAFDEGNDIVIVVPQGADEGSKRWQAASEGGGHPALEEGLGAGEIAVAPELFELVFQDPRAVDAAVAAGESVERAGVRLGAAGRAHAEQPAQALDGSALLGPELAPLLLAHLVDRFVERLDQVEAIDHEGGIRAMSLDGLGVGATHVAAGPEDALLLPLAQVLVEEPVDGLAALSLPDPHDAGTVEVVDEGGVAMPPFYRRFRRPRGFSARARHARCAPG